MRQPDTHERPQPRPITVLIVDDDPLVRTGWRAILETEPDISVAGESGDGAEVRDLVLRVTPDVVIMDVRMPRVDGISATRHLLATVPAAPRVLVVTTFGNDDYVYDALRAGASGFLLKRCPADELVRAVRTIAAGDSLLFPEAIRSLAAAHARPAGDWLRRAGLTEREAQVLREIAAGKSNAEIGADLYLSVETVRTHVRNVLGKLGVRDRTQAVIAAYESGFVIPGG
ncbi:response regulator transcription factor [Nocardia lijiangensis]|uniref:response regulator transcription factor n=1 Tax=Nocardia lijiangensis TaxID=299618 RepID=UPI00082EFA0D|nr:response regulator transcription factor [Nocardia lijiangensis]